MAGKTETGKLEAEAKTRAETKAKLESIFIPKGDKNEENFLYIAVNGKAYQVPRGQTVQVPPEIAYEIRRAERAREKQDKFIEANSH